jgi:hypothetical protein
VGVLDAQVIQRTLRVPAPTGTPGDGDGAVVARQLDAVLLVVGFAATPELLNYRSRLRPGRGHGRRRGDHRCGVRAGG